MRGARNIPCETRPGKRAPTAKMCESDEEYVPLNDGYNWKGDPNATLSGQDIPQPPTGTSTGTSTPPHCDQPLYDPPPAPTSGRTGTSTPNPTWPRAPKDKTWQSMLMPPTWQ